MCSLVVGALVAVLLITSTTTAQAQTLPAQFAENAVATNIQNPVGMEIADDGRLFVIAGNVRRIEIYDDNGYVNEFLRLEQAYRLGSGLLGLEFAPDFATSGDVFVAYITNTDFVSGPQRFRLSKFSSDGTTADPASEVVLFEVDDINPEQPLHQGGDIGIGADGKLYWALGDRVRGSSVAQPFDTHFGKLLRLNLDGTIPTDNVNYDSFSGDLRAVIANGLRNPFRMESRPSTGELFISDVGRLTWEELNRAEQGANYGWPVVEGIVNDPLFTDPTFAYNHSPDGCAITGGAFYEPAVTQFPSEFHGDFFYGDHCFGWIAHFDPVTGTDTRFLSGANRLVEIKINPQTG